MNIAEEDEDDEEDEEDNSDSEDDPDRLWCICKRPHNNRFMICCDVCEDWFHGKCVHVSKAMGKYFKNKIFIEREIKYSFLTTYTSLSNRPTNGRKRYRMGLSKLFKEKS